VAAKMLADYKFAGWQERKDAGATGGCMDRGGNQQHGVGCSHDLGNGTRRNRRSVWHIATQPYPEAHFAVMPEKLVVPCVLAGCPSGGTVLDPFAGAGTVGVAACKLGRDFIGCELNPEYVEMAERRIEPCAAQMTMGVA